ncbi:MAG: hypothetical protein GW763_07120 [Paraglaciecola sp.]|nr:hypothetical protein [Paraglaciecola sp.]NCT47747.1 hypothetical protein [Paraglaciecola sp.]
MRLKKFHFLVITMGVLWFAMSIVYMPITLRQIEVGDAESILFSVHFILLLVVFFLVLMQFSPYEKIPALRRWMKRYFLALVLLFGPVSGVIPFII